MAQGDVGRGWPRGDTINSGLKCWLTHRYREQARSHRGACVRHFKRRNGGAGLLVNAVRQRHLARRDAAVGGVCSKLLHYLRELIVPSAQCRNTFATGCILAASREEGYDALFNGACEQCRNESGGISRSYPRRFCHRPQTRCLNPLRRYYLSVTSSIGGM